MNDLYKRFGQQQNVGPFGNLMQRMSEFKQFASGFKGDPGQTVQQMLNDGRISQEQLNQIMPFAQQMYNLLHGSK